MMQKGSAAVFIILGVLLLSILAGVAYFKSTSFMFKAQGQNKLLEKLATPKPSNSEKIRELIRSGADQNAIMEEVFKDDEVKKSSVNHINALIRGYYVNTNNYPKVLADLRSEFNLDDGELVRYTNPPFYYGADKEENKFFVKLNDGEDYYGDVAAINKHLDAMVWVSVGHLTTGVDFFLEEKSRLPETLEESIKGNPDLAHLKVPKNPVTGKPYTYVRGSDGRSFTVSGTQSDGSEYKAR